MSDSDAQADLAASIRKLLEVTIQARPDDASIAEASSRVRSLTEKLRSYVPDPVPPRYPFAAGGQSTFEEIFAYDFVMGTKNPVAAPVRFANEGNTAVGFATFGSVYEGPPGCVHGAVIAGVFDQVLNIANMLHGTPGPTVRLEFDFRKPTPLNREIRFEGVCQRVEGKRIHSTAKCISGDVVTVEAQGVFAVIDLEKLDKLGL